MEEAAKARDLRSRFVVPSPGYLLCSARTCPLILHCRHTEYSHVYVPMWYTSVPVTKSPSIPLIQTDESPAARVRPVNTRRGVMDGTK
ncbi:hypothetical protein ARMGADRAFT_569172 [Armillaria gallica]|uniref:Uncharacterized protein n=1 Tax=Armillaria gallica TaxID=47427 RepID=A0A2H3DSH3_ARMGA|nr:hypothetical protein ARMGADRAFT_569172 [Armillaria gallica]